MLLSKEIGGGTTSFTFHTAKQLQERIIKDYKGTVTKVQLCQLLREVSNTMDPRWIKNYALSMQTAGLLKEISEGVFQVEGK